jgi:serine/threonine protein phosphatase PrpC
MHVDSEAEKTGTKRASIAKDDAMTHAALTDIGLERVVNEDRCATMPTGHGVCYVVLDGMGGAEGGEFAAQLSIDSLYRSFESDEDREPREALQLAIEEANRAVVLRRSTKKFREMGTTIVGALIEGSSVAVAHVGDSRAYLIQGDGIQQLTVDHTYVQQLVDRNEISREEALPHPQSHILTQCLGSSEAIRVDVNEYWIWPLKKGEVTDFIVLCTDGLYSMMTEDEIWSAVRSLAPQKACDHLVALANSRGGFDNITVSIIPLHGHLKDSVSPTRNKEIAARERSKRRKRWWQRSFAFHVVVAALGGFLAAAVAVGVFFYARVL